MTRFFDVLFAVLGLLFFSPLFLVIGILIVLDSGMPVFYRQIRVGLEGRDFKLWKFRTMVNNADKKGQLTVGMNDSRITRIGGFLRKYKLDELPQLLNVLFGTMSFVGPRPEVRKYVNMYNHAQMRVLRVKPGITDVASIAYSNENELLAKAEDPEKMYIEEVMPEKLRLNMEYISNPSVWNYFKIILLTALKILK